MSSSSSDLTVALLREAFGPEAGELASKLIPWTSLPFSKIGHQYKTQLCILIHHGFVRLVPPDSEYSLDQQAVQRLVRVPRFLYAVKSTLGNEGETIFEEVFLAGRICISETLKRAYSRLKDSNKSLTFTHLLDSFKSLIKHRFVKRISDDPVHQFLFPEDKVDTQVLHKSVNDESFNIAFGDAAIFWSINANGFHSLFMNQIIICSCTRRFDASAGLLLKIFLEEVVSKELEPVEHSKSLYQNQILSHLEILQNETQKPRLKNFLSQYLNVITEDRTRFLNKIGDSGGGEYHMNFKSLFEQLVHATFDNVVLEKFGSKALRIFRVIRSHKRIEESALANLVMIPAKETKLLTYKLLENNFIQLQELRKSVASNAVAKGFYLFYIDTDSVARMVRELCFKAIGNCIFRKDHEFSIHQRLLDKQERMDTIIENLKNSKELNEEELKYQITEVYEMLSPAERDSAKKIHNVLDKLTLATGQIDETLFLIDMYLFFHVKSG
ncbi:DNA-directed RNA polymerase III subunit RPC3 [Lepeophtheirus salmonis]|uniref:DNA-directed RNA polymerase III subunit RPC3 n=1 Tax=Lepeophtheirus salmonis TaxID=72036 RepID=C1BUX3_LEPSM|nr:DNA-directed RNA polymerase III subunit RPC3-like [Lepeophtheirus salmonis]ACO12826.1 DNA-directed RNA polymerase III subunit RPC3 [Lepeophtheirus salmonis]